MDYREDIKRSVEALRSGGVILYPTDTIWGLGCDAADEMAVKKIYAIKKRPVSTSMIILVDSASMLERYTTDTPDIAFELIDVADEPLTLVLPVRAGLLAPQLISDDGFIGIRICRDDFCSTLIGKLRKPIVSTSANISGDTPPAIFAEISEEVTEGVDYVVNYRQNDTGRAKPSPVIKILPNGTIEILRK